MRLRVCWHPAALHVFYRLPIHSATLVDRTVLRFIEHGEGDLEWDAPYYILRAGFFDVILSIDRQERTAAVLHIYRRHR